LAKKLDVFPQIQMQSLVLFKETYWYKHET